MAHPGEPAVGGAPRHRACGDTRAEQIELSDSPEGRRIEQKLRAEAVARHGGDEDAAVADPTGHA
jgi:hypothetical protein